MDFSFTKIQRSSAIYNKSKNQPPVNYLTDSLFFCCLTSLICSLFFSTSFWAPISLQASSTNLSLFLSSLYQVTISVFPSSKFVFVVGNLIVALLVGESKIFSTKKASNFDEENVINRIQNFRGPLIVEREEKRPVVLGNRVFEGEECVDEQIILDDEFYEPSLDDEELSKRADDFIARVNMQRKIEAGMCEWTTTMRKKYRKKNCLKDCLRPL